MTLERVHGVFVKCSEVTAVEMYLSMVHVHNRAILSICFCILIDIKNEET